MTTSDPSRRAGLREWAGLAVLALPCLLVSMDANVLGLALPALTADLQPTSAQLLWIVDSYVFFVAGMLITMGVLGDRIGRRRLLLIGGAAFGVASLLAAFSTSAAMLITARAVLGVAGATLMPSTLSLIRNMFTDPRQRTTAFGVWTASFAMGGVIAPLVAGLLLRHFWWGSVFLVAVPVIVLLLVFGPVLLPEFCNPDATRIDLRSAALSLIAVLAVVFGLKRLAQGGGEPTAVLSVAVGVVLAVAFVRRQRRQASPSMDLQLFRRRAFTMPLATNGLAFFVLYGSQLFVAQYLQLVLGLSALRAGLWTIPSAVAYLVGSVLGPMIANRVRPAVMLGSSLLVSAVGFGLLTQVRAASGLVVVVTGSVVLSLGLSPVYIVATEMTISAAPPERAGAASAILETCAELGGALGIAVLGSIGAAVYRHSLPDVAPPGVNPELWESARSTLGGAIAAAQRLPARAGDELADEARDAFTRGFQVAHTVGTAIIVVLAVASLLLLTRSELTSSRREDPRPSAELQRSQ
jgi:DHA2 family multidrug resistance protein-like MFS transporter